VSESDSVGTGAVVEVSGFREVGLVRRVGLDSFKVFCSGVNVNDESGRGGRRKWGGLRERDVLGLTLGAMMLISINGV
jgi:hypothetical protein